MPAAQASTLAKDAVLGQVLGFVALDEASSHPYVVKVLGDLQNLPTT